MTENQFEKDVILAKQVVIDEVGVAKDNLQPTNDDMEMFVSLLDTERQEKDYDWNADIRIPEFASHYLTQSSIDVGQYFQTRDFVEVYLEDGSEEAKAHADATKELLNRTLNRKNLYHYLKFIRAKGMATLCGRVYLKCWWEQTREEAVVDYDTIYEPLDVDNYGNPLVSEDQIPAMTMREEPVMGEVPIIDQFNYDVWDQRNVFTDNSYVYSLQQKQWITLRSEMTLSEIKGAAEENGYFNVKEVEKMRPAHKTEFKKESYDKDQAFNPVTSAVEKPYDIYERYGAYWYLPNKEGKKAIGIDRDGKPMKNAELRECIITVACAGTKRVLIGFKENPYRDAYDKPYRPIIRGLCYVHLTEDGGVGDGKYTKELQVAIDDTFNVSQDRTMLATLPTIKTSVQNIEDNSTLYFEPGHAMTFYKDPNEIQEFKISSDTMGALQQINFLKDAMQQVDSIQPPAMGQSGMASTTATAFSGAAYATGERAQYKQLTFENTALTELYWMIQQMTYQFAMPETAYMLMGEKVFNFDPGKDFFYKPLSQSIEPEHSKLAKQKNWITILGYVAQVPHPDTVVLVNKIIAEIVKLMGDEYESFGQALNPAQPIENQPAGGTEQVAGPANMPMSNQNMIPMSGAEMGTRGIANIGAI